MTRTREGSACRGHKKDSLPKKKKKKTGSRGPLRPEGREGERKEPRLRGRLLALDVKDRAGPSIRRNPWRRPGKRGVPEKWKKKKKKKKAVPGPMRRVTGLVAIPRGRRR